jgi:hypothetical protein
MKNSEPLKADWNGLHLKVAGARPGRKGLGFKNHEASFFSWAGSAHRSRSAVDRPGLVGAGGHPPDRAAS